ncbi:hypothetical protein STEG23_003484 [Scotinomys teguina]
MRLALAAHSPCHGPSFFTTILCGHDGLELFEASSSCSSHCSNSTMVCTQEQSPGRIHLVPAAEQFSCLFAVLVSAGNSDCSENLASCPKEQIKAAEYAGQLGVLLSIMQNQLLAARGPVFHPYRQTAQSLEMLVFSSGSFSSISIS